MKVSRSSAWLLGAAVVLLAALGYASAPAGRYTVASGTVTDTKTGLVWQQKDDGNDYTWADAKTLCGGLNLNGGGWRLPTMKELQTIVDFSVAPQTSPMIDPLFTNARAADYWSASPLSGSASKAWVVYFDYGSSGTDDITNSDHVRCVR